MLTFFTIPKAFSGHSNVIQRNAIQSWLHVPACEIILCGDDAGILEVAKEFGVVHIPKIEKNEFGTPLLDSAFTIAQRRATYDILVYINTDIIVTSDFIKAVQTIPLPLFLGSGRRWDLDITEELDFSDVDWEKNLKARIDLKGRLHGFSGIDYFIFPRNFRHELPAFAVGRPGWDNWLIYHTRSLNIPVIDATEAITIVHQSHDYSHSPYGRKKRVEGPEAKRNFELAGGFSHMMTLRDADFILTLEGVKKPPFFRGILAKLSMFRMWRLLFSMKRRLQNHLK